MTIQVQNLQKYYLLGIQVEGLYMSETRYLAQWGLFATQNQKYCKKTAIVQWIRLYLQSCSPGFESQANQILY